MITAQQWSNGVELYGPTKLGRAKWYKITVVANPNGTATMLTEKASKIGGKSQTDTYNYDKGVNIGKKNETTALEQAYAEAESLYNSLLDKGYKPSLQQVGIVDKTDAAGLIKPMLAEKYKAKRVVFPCYVQPKLDGARAMAQCINGEIKLTSRNGKPWEAVPHIENELKQLFEIVGENIILDGELYRHGWGFQRVISAIKKQSADSSGIKFMVFDYVNNLDKNENYEERRAVISSVFADVRLSNIELLYADIADDEATIKSFADDYVQRGYEGAIVRNKRGVYEKGYRSANLLKYKTFEDEEFEIVDVLEATGRDEDTAVFVCALPNGTRFNCRPIGTREERNQYWVNRNQLIGKMLTVKFQGKSDDGIPRFPVGKCIRDYE